MCKGGYYLNNEFGMFEDEEIMVFPESIDNIEPSKSNYIFSTTKLILMFVGILPLIVLTILILSEFGFVPAITFFGLYFLIYLFLVRLYVVEEPRQRDSLNQLEDNKVSDYSFFWDVSKVGTSKNDNGLLYLRQDGISLKRAYVVKFDSGSIVGVSPNFLREFRESLQLFLRGVQMDIKWYSIQKKPSLNKSLKHQSQNLITNTNQDLNKLIKIQLNNYLRYSMDADQRYVNYIVIINDKFETLSTFKENLEDILNRSLRTNSSFKNVTILEKDELDEFMSTYYMQDLLDITTIRKTSRTKPFSSYANVISVVDKDDRELPMEILDIINRDVAKYSGGYKLEQISDRVDKEEANLEKTRVREYENAKKELFRKRSNEDITFEEYKEQLVAIEKNYSKENFIPNRKEKEKQEAKERRIKERNDKRIADKEFKEEQKRLANLPEEKWFEKEEYTDDIVDVIDTNTFVENDDLVDNLDNILEDNMVNQPIETESNTTESKKDADNDDNPSSSSGEFNVYDILE